MAELMQRDEDTLVQQRLHADSLGRGSTIVEACEDGRRNPVVEMAGSGLPSGSGGEASRGEGARESARTGTEAARSSGETLQPGSGEPMQTAPEDADTRQGLKKSAELPIDDPKSEVRGRGLHLDHDVPIVTPTVQQTERPADAAEAHISMGRMELISNAAAKMMNAAVTCELTSAEVWCMPEMRELLNDGRVHLVQGPMCHWRLASTGDGNEQGLVRGKTTWATSSSRVATLLAREHAGENRRVRLIGRNEVIAASM